MPDQIIDKTYRRSGTFFEKAAVHVEMAEPFCPVLRRIILEQASTAERASPSAGEGITAHERGCYVCMEGPAFSTRAESLMHRLWGGDLIGMTAMPEAKLAREAEIPYALIGLVTDYDSWKSAAPAAPGQAAQTAECANGGGVVGGNHGQSSGGGGKCDGVDPPGASPDRGRPCAAAGVPGPRGVEVGDLVG